MMRTEQRMGLGVYTLAEVARYTGVAPVTVRSWFKGRSDGNGRGPVFQSDITPVHKDYAASFFDLIDVLVVGQLRSQGVSLRVVGLAQAQLRTELGVIHPFCHANIYTDGRKVFSLVANEIGDEQLKDAVSKQQLFIQFKKSLSHIEYSNTSHLAERWKIMDGVVLDPKVSMGKPVVLGSGVTTFVVANQYVANNKNIDLVAELYNVTGKDVLHAVDFEDKHGYKRAA